MKKALKIFGLWLLCLLVIWMFTAFIFLEANPFSWETNHRYYISFVSFMALVAASSIITQD